MLNEFLTFTYQTAIPLTAAVLFWGSVIVVSLIILAGVWRSIFALIDDFLTWIISKI